MQAISLVFWHPAHIIAMSSCTIAIIMSGGPLPSISAVGNSDSEIDELICGSNKGLLEYVQHIESDKMKIIAIKCICSTMDNIHISCVALCFISVLLFQNKRHN